MSKIPDDCDSTPLRDLRKDLEERRMVREIMLVDPDFFKSLLGDAWGSNTSGGIQTPVMESPPRKKVFGDSILGRYLK